MMNDDAIISEATQILEQLATILFEDCCTLDKTLKSLPLRAGLYAVRHRQEGILYIGKTLNLRNRFMNGHKAVFYAYADRYPIEDIRVAVFLLSYEQRLRALELEARMLQIAQPRYNSRIRKSES
jgi:excinuclease UvrABC nuclease subunit